MLEAARTLFHERGFERTTTRDIGDLAGLDPTLIARYFGNKAALYLQVLRADFAASGPDAPPDLLQPGRVTELLDRLTQRGPGPIFDSALRSQGADDVQAEARQALSERVVDPLEARIAAAAVGDARLRAEIITAAFIGIAVSRHAGAFPQLSSAPIERVTELVTRALAVLADPNHIR